MVKKSQAIQITAIPVVRKFCDTGTTSFMWPEPAGLPTMLVLESTDEIWAEFWRTRPTGMRYFVKVDGVEFKLCGRISSRIKKLFVTPHIPYDSPCSMRTAARKNA